MKAAIKIDLAKIDPKEIFRLVEAGVIKGSILDPSDPKADEVLKGRARRDPNFISYKSPKFRKK